MDTKNLVGQVLAGRYRIDDFLGEGSISTVYRAYDSDRKQSVLVKVILAGLASDAGFQDRFEEQGKAVVQLRHPNIVQVLDYGHDGDHYYIVEDLVLGETLRKRLRRLNKAGKRMSMTDASEYALQISDAAGYAHQQGMLHRDIRPANILLNAQGKAMLMDFGMVQIGGGHRHTATGAVTDTALYMPPEIIRGEVPDPRSDLYSLGVTLYELLSGHPPFEASSVATLLMMHLKDPVPDVREVRSGVPAELSSVLSRALAKDRDERYASMADLGRALQGSVELLQSGAELELQATALEVVEPTLGPLQRGAAPSLQATALDMVEPTAEPVLVAGPTRPGWGTPSADPSAVTLRGRDGQPAVAATMMETGTPRPLRAEPAAPPQVKVEPARGQPATPKSVVRPASTPVPPESRSGRPGRRWVWIGAAVLLVILGLGITLALVLGSGENKPPTDVADAPAGSEGSPTEPASGSPTPASGMVVLPSSESEATTGGAAAPVALPPSSPITVTITGITLNPEAHYVVDYQVLGLPEVMTTTHLHFFFNTLPFDKAGAPSDKTWMTWFGPSPFTDSTAADRPTNASQMCVQAANPNHTPVLGTGSCAPLPDLVLASSAQGIDGFFGPGTSYPVVARLQAGEQALVLGLSPDELWWNVVNPDNPDQTYWISTVDTQVTGNVSMVPLVEGPPPGATPPQSLSVEITGVTTNAENQYVADFTVEGFTPAYPGTHIHFYFNTFTPDQVGIGGEANRRSHGGPSPFSGYSTEDRPGGATELCAIVANPDHTVVPNSGNCFALPSLPTIELTNITRNDQDQYVVDFVAKDFVPQYPGGTHIHFYFNIFTADQVGIGGEANRRSYGGAPPFTGYALADRPEGATQLCAVVANPDHTVIPNSGSCSTLPGLPTLEIIGINLDDEGRYVVDFVPHQFTPQYPGGTHIHFYFNTFTPDQVGIGGEANRRSYGDLPPFTGYAAADRPEMATQLCGVVANPDHTVIPNSGDCYHLPDVLDVEITGITVDSQNRYVVEYVTYGFTSHWPGTHVHFFFDTVMPEDLGKKGGSTNFSHGGSSPYAGYSTADRPEGATQLCAIVALPDNTVVHDSHHCFPLP